MEVEVSGNKYSTGKLTPRQQLHVARRIAPIVTGLLGSIAAKPEDVQHKSDDEVLALVAGPIMTALASMIDADVDYVVDTCMGVVERRDGDGWAKVQIAPGRYRYDDITMREVLQLCRTVIQENLGGFFPGQLST